MKILIADDSKLIVSLITSLLKSLNENTEVISAFDGNEAVEKAEKNIPELILLDWQMPNLDGIEALKKLKSSNNTKNIPVVMLTATENTSEALLLGAMDCIKKPFQKEEFFTKMNQILSSIK